MATYRIGNHTFEADNLGKAIDHVKTKGLTGKLIRTKGSVDPASSDQVNDRMVTTTCGWGKTAHKWTGLLSEVVANKNTCPDHRG